MCFLSLLSWLPFGYSPILKPSEGASLQPSQSHTWEGQVHAELLAPSDPQSAVPCWDLWRSQALHPSSCSVLCTWDPQQSSQCSGLTVSYRHNCFSFWPHFYAHMDCNPDWTGSGGQMSTSPIPLHFKVSCLRFLLLSRKSGSPYTCYPDTWMTSSISSPSVLHRENLCLSFVSAGSLRSMYTLVPLL